MPEREAKKILIIEMKKSRSQERIDFGNFLLKWLALKETFPPFNRRLKRVSYKIFKHST